MSTPRRTSRLVMICLGVIVTLVAALTIAAVQWARYESRYLHERRIDVNARLRANSKAIARERHDVASLACLLIEGIDPGTLPGVDAARRKYRCTGNGHTRIRSAEHTPEPSSQPGTQSHAPVTVRSPRSRSAPQSSAPPSTPIAQPPPSASPTPRPSSSAQPTPSTSALLCGLPIVSGLCGPSGLP